MPDLPERTPYAMWTDDEWLEVIKRFPPDASTQITEEWVAEQRKKANDQQQT